MDSDADYTDDLLDSLPAHLRNKVLQHLARDANGNPLQLVDALPPKGNGPAAGRQHCARNHKRRPKAVGAAFWLGGVGGASVLIAAGVVALVSAPWWLVAVFAGLIGWLAWNDAKVTLSESKALDSRSDME